MPCSRNSIASAAMAITEPRCFAPWRRLKSAMNAAGEKALNARLKDAGWSVLGVDGGASSAILGTFIAGMGDADMGEESDCKHLAASFAAGLRAVEKQTRARPGDKTMMDALVPAVQVFEAAARFRRADCAGHGEGGRGRSARRANHQRYDREIRARQVPGRKDTGIAGRGRHFNRSVVSRIQHGAYDRKLSLDRALLAVARRTSDQNSLLEIDERKKPTCQIRTPPRWFA